MAEDLRDRSPIRHVEKRVGGFVPVINVRMHNPRSVSQYTHGFVYPIRFFLTLIFRSSLCKYIQCNTPPAAFSHQPLIDLIPGPHGSLDPLVYVLCSSNPRVSSPHRWFIPPISIVRLARFLIPLSFIQSAARLCSGFATPFLASLVGCGNPFGSKEK